MPTDTGSLQADIAHYVVDYTYGEESAAAALVGPHEKSYLAGIATAAALAIFGWWAFRKISEN